ncbi:MAG: hypothetical protein NWE98_02080 [Candidatus Bathyarchaeota archaeon]|nr:hypothetical protein [Candidatus Bathyarchaeota archaeon]
MDRPDIVLKDYLSNEQTWTFTEEGLTLNDIVFSTRDWTDTGAFKNGKPHVVVKLAGWERLQEAEETLHKFIFIVEVAVHCPDKTESTVEAKKTLQWLIGEKVKFLVDGIDASVLSGWNSAVANLGTFADAIEVLPETLVLNITVTAYINWVQGGN